MAPEPAAIGERHRARRVARLLDRRIAPRHLIAVLVLWLGLDMLLLWRFLGLGSWWDYLGGAGAVAVMARMALTQVAPLGTGPSLRVAAVCAAAATMLLMLGGEGRLFYANYDWMVRDGVLHDMGTHPWPFAYMARGVPEVLRAPIGMYLVPSLAMKAGGQAAGDWVLLGQNSLLLTILLSLAAGLFTTAARRLAALAVFVFFSGLDIAGAAITKGYGFGELSDHLEAWAGPFQFSSHITQLFWVPQHALAGWACAIGYMLWRDGRLPLGVFLALVPLTTLWSPLASFGAMPFAMFAMATAWRRDGVRSRDLALPATASLLAAPALLYMSAASQSVGGTIGRLDVAAYAKFELFETVPFIAALLAARLAPRFGWPTLGLAAAVLFVLPGVQLGSSADLAMRASIPSLAILSVMMANLVVEERRPGRRVWLVALLMIGGVTGLHEVWRAMTWPASPPPLCTFYDAWWPAPPSAKSTYLAPVDQMPALVRPHVLMVIPAGHPAPCWARPWPRPRMI